MVKDNDVLLSVSRLKVKFNHHLILKGISLRVKKYDTLAIIGPNGAGKSVLFRALLGLIPYEGKVNWSPHIKIGYVPQKVFVAKDIPLTVAEFLGFKTKDSREILAVLTQVGFEGNNPRLLTTRLGVLSGGEFQRVLIAFALLGDPQVLLFDEPTSGIDVSGEETVYHLIHKLQKQKQLTIIFISHELEIVYKYANKVLCLNKQAICFGPPRKVIDKQNLEQLYGEDIHFYHHHTNSHEH